MKTYQKPQAKLIIMESTAILAGSLNVYDDYADESPIHAPRHRHFLEDEE